MPPLVRRRHSLAVLLALAPLGWGAACGGQRLGDAPRREALAAEAAPPTPAAGDTTFAALVAQLSEPGGYFDTDNLVSNESSYLHVVDALRARGVQGGAYVGVGPDQNFSYIAAIRPEVAFLVDIRRDNLLQHLFYRALFELADDRAAYLELLTGRALPAGELAGTERALEELLRAIDRAGPDGAAATDARRRVLDAVLALGVPLSVEDQATITRIHDAFIGEALDLRFTSHGRPPRDYYPTLRQLLLERDRSGTPRSYLAGEAAYRTVRDLQRAGRVIPVVGDLAGEHALAAIGRDIARRGLAVSALYTSNVEYYLARGGSLERFAATAAALPRDARSVVIRSCFGYACGDRHPQAVPGYQSVQLLQSLDTLARLAADRRPLDYRTLVRHHILPQP